MYEFLQNDMLVKAVNELIEEHGVEDHAREIPMNAMSHHRASSPPHSIVFVGGVLKTDEYSCFEMFMLDIARTIACLQDENQRLWKDLQEKIEEIDAREQLYKMYKESNELLTNVPNEPEAFDPSPPTLEVHQRRERLEKWNTQYISPRPSCRLVIPCNGHELNYQAFVGELMHSSAGGFSAGDMDEWRILLASSTVEHRQDNWKTLTSVSYDVMVY